jgi:transcription initiation factor IIF auxiliary subunit
MALKIAQEFEYKGEDWWVWWIWIDAPDAELDQIEQVVYTLHPTFPEPVRTVKDRMSKFRLSTAGWGAFRIQAKVVWKSGSHTKLVHELVLRYPNGEPTAA